MGQYYKPIIVSHTKKTILGYWEAFKTMNGRKLMEHSYIGNSLCNCVENYLYNNGGGRVVWAGDYADADKGKKSNLYELAEELKKTEFAYDCKENDKIRYLVNDDKNEYIDLWNVLSIGELTIHPLPLLTAEGNGQGSGDYDGLDMKYVGSWARNFIRVMPNGSYADLEKNYKLINPKFVEGYKILETFGKLVGLVEESLTEDYDYADNERYVNTIKDGIKQMRKALPKKK